MSILGDYRNKTSYYIKLSDLISLDVQSFLIDFQGKHYKQNDNRQMKEEANIWKGSKRI